MWDALRTEAQLRESSLTGQGLVSRLLLQGNVEDSSPEGTDWDVQGAVEYEHRECPGRCLARGGGDPRDTAGLQ